MNSKTLIPQVLPPDDAAPLAGNALALPSSALALPGSSAAQLGPVGLLCLDNPDSQRTILESARVLMRLLDPAGRLTSDPHAFPWTEVQATHASVIRNQMAERYKPATVNKHLSILRGILKKCLVLHANNVQLANQLRLAIDVKSVRSNGADTGRMLEEHERKKLLEATRQLPSPRRERDMALIAVALSTGLRRAEIAAIEMKHLDREAATITMSTKRRKVRTVYLDDGTLEVLDAWLKVRSDAPGPLFCPLWSKGESIRLPLRALSKSGVNAVIIELAHAAGLKHFTPHDLRRTFISTLFDSGIDGSMVQSLAGHSSFSTTTRYDKRGKKKQQAAIRQLNLVGKAMKKETK